MASPDVVATRKPSKQADINPLDRAELRLYLLTLGVHFSRYYPFMFTLARTGLQLGEALSLEWDHIVFKNRWIEVKQAYCHTRRKVQGTKNSLSRRVDMSQQFTETLRELQRARKWETLQQGWGDIHRRVFVNEAVCIIDGDNLRRRVHAVAHPPGCTMTASRSGDVRVPKRMLPSCAASVTMTTAMPCR